MDEKPEYGLPQIVRMKLASIDRTPHYQIRLGQRSLRNLASLREAGLRDPIHLQRKAPLMRILDGHDRVECAAMIGWRDLLAIVHDVDDMEARRLSWQLNAERTQMTQLERLNAIELFVEAGMKNSEIARVIGLKHEVSVSRLRGSLPLSRRYWSLLREGKLLPKHIQALKRLPKSRWDAWVKKTVDEGLSANALTRAVRPKRRRVVEERAGGAFTVWTYLHDPDRTDDPEEVERHAEQLDQAADHLRAWCRHRRQQLKDGKG